MLEYIYYLCTQFHTEVESIKTTRMGGAYKKKGVNVRFGFDVLRISQVRTTSQKQSNCDVPRMIISPSKRFVIVKRYIYHSVWGSSSCSFRLVGQCESL